MATRIGKHAPCPCKSGHKFGDCHGKSPEPFENQINSIPHDPRLKPSWDAMVDARVPYEGVKFSFVHNGKRFRFVGDKLFLRRQEETFHEFLFFFFGQIMGHQWFEKQKQLPQEKRHEMHRWHDVVTTFWKSLRSDILVGDHFSAEAPGDVWDLLTLAHDVFHLSNAGTFNKKLKRRLLDYHDFQGVRYEIAVAALLTRAGLKVESVPQAHDKKRHDWNAYDPSTGTKMAVEAKSRHRLGALHEHGEPDTEKIHRGDVANLIGQALDQNPGDCPFLVFADLNVPREPGVPIEQRPWFNDVWQDMQSLGTPTPENPDEFTAVFFTNFWHHWAGTATATGIEYLHVISHCPRYSIPVALEGRLMAAVQNYSFIPRQI